MFCRKNGYSLVNFLPKLREKVIFNFICDYKQSNPAVSMGAAPKLCSEHEGRLEVNGSTGIAAVA